MMAALAAAAKSDSQNDSEPQQLPREKSAASIISKLSNSSNATATTGGLDRPKPAFGFLAKRPSMWNSVHKFLVKDKPPAPVKKYENTFKMKPDDETGFKGHKVRDVVEDILQSRLQGEKYDKGRANNLARNLSEVIKMRIKKLNISRHKIVVFVVIGSCQEQCLRMGSRCVWDERTDDYVSANYKNGSLFAVATVYGIYFE